MPYKSKAQERWAHTESGEKALGSEGINEWDQASKGKKLPEKKMADGGIVDELKQHLSNLYDKAQKGPLIEDSNLQGMHDVMAKQSDLDDVSDGPHYDPMKADQPTGTVGEITVDVEPQKMSDGGIIGDLAKLFHSDKSDAAQADAVDTVDASTDTAKGYADGGVVDDSMGVMGMDSGNPDTYKLRNPPVPQLPPAPVTPSFDPHAGLAPHLSNPNVQPPAPAPVAVAPPSDPNGLQNYIAQQKQQVGAYGPEQQMALEKSILERQRSPGALAGSALAGLGDAVMQGVARAGPSNFQANLQNKIGEQGKQALDVQKNAHLENKEDIQSQMALTAKDPASPLSKTAQTSYGPLLRELGATPQQIAQMPADLIGEVATKNITLKEALARLSETSLYHEQMGEQAKAALGEKASEFETANPIKEFIHKHLNTDTAPTVALPSSMPSLGAGKITPDVSAYAAKHGITPEQALQIKMQRGGK